ncbi:MAG: ABC transporter transmembrane domain-containing protein [Planctomycetota bacterium]
MKNFGRALRLAMRYRLTVAGAAVSAILVAVLWGGNIGALYPFIEVAVQGQSLQQWAEREIRQSNAEVAEHRSQIAGLEEDLRVASGRELRKLESAVRAARSRIEAEEAHIARVQGIRPWIDKYLPHDPFLTLALITLVLLVGTLVKDVLIVANGILVSRLSQLAAFDLRKLFYRRTLRMDLATFGDEGTTDLMSRFTHDLESVANGIDALFGKLVREPLKMIACLVGAAVICWRLLLLSLIVAPLAGFLIRWLGKTLKRANRRAMEEMAQIYNKLEETFRGIKVVKAFTNEQQQRRHFHQGSKAYLHKSLKIAGYDALVHPITELMGIITICLALLAGAWLVLKGKTDLLGIPMTSRPLSLSALLIFYGLLAGVADPMRKFSDVFNRLQRAAAAADRIYDRLDREPKIRDPRCPAPRTRHARELVFENVVFGYRPDQPVLQVIDLTIPFGQTLAIVGPNGCGKSTLANMVPRFFDPDAGRILLDGVPIAAMRLRDLRGQIGMVAQETTLFDESVLENIRYGSPRATRDDVIRAARQAHAHEFIERDLPHGYDTVVGALGGRLSGGQRQRIALARAILRNPSILILDEATSQIDLESEQAIQDALADFIRGRTTIIITHRLSILSLAQQIAVMQAGRIIDCGTQQELLSRCALYRRLHQIQFEEPSGSAAAA